jgi:2-keto-3-deoxy-L-rhamnonate aldolase RhmA
LNSAVRRSLAAGELTVGTWGSLGSVAAAELLCDAGFDWVVVDREHSALSYPQTEALIRAIDGRGKAALVRLSSHDPVEIKRVMDAGAHGLIAPMVNTRAQADALWAAMQYPPLGRRGVGLSRAQRYGPGFEAYRQWLPDGAALIVQIEHRDALEHLDDILSAPHVHGCLLGPYDLSASMGAPGDLEDARVVAALAAVREAAERNGVPPGLHVVEPDGAELRRRVDEGWRFIAFGVDFRMIDYAAREGLRALD